MPRYEIVVNSEELQYIIRCLEEMGVRLGDPAKAELMAKLYETEFDDRRYRRRMRRQAEREAARATEIA